LPRDARTEAFEAVEAFDALSTAFIGG